MAITKKTIDDYTGLPGFLDWKTMGGGSGGGVPTSGLGTALVGALTAGALVAGTGSTSAGSTGTAKPNIKIPESNAELDEMLDTSAPDSAVPDSAVEETQQPDPELPDDKDTPDIEDKTTENVENAIDNTDMLEMLKGLRDEQWAREDAIRAETQQREDTAFSRGIADMRRAGVNVNLVGAQPAESGGGITNATGVDLGMLETALNNEGQTLIAMLNNEFKGDENTKDRILQGISSAISLTGQIIMAYLFKKGTKGGG